jgi:hypothetical protein
MQNLSTPRLKPSQISKEGSSPLQPEDAEFSGVLSGDLVFWAQKGTSTARKTANTCEQDQ